VEFVDVTGGDPFAFNRDDEYSDYHHMTPEGARRFTTLLAAALRDGASPTARSVLSRSPGGQPMAHANVRRAAAAKDPR
jgi:hypothetical protein